MSHGFKGIVVRSEILREETIAITEQFVVGRQVEHRFACVVGSLKRHTTISMQFGGEVFIVAHILQTIETSGRFVHVEHSVARHTAQHGNLGVDFVLSQFVSAGGDVRHCLILRAGIEVEVSSHKVACRERHASLGDMDGCKVANSHGQICDIFHREGCTAINAIPESHSITRTTIV